jgi:hypothetical protein
LEKLQKDIEELKPLKTLQKDIEELKPLKTTVERLVLL